MVEGAELAELEWDTYRSDRKDNNVNNLHLVTTVKDAAFEQGVRAGLARGPDRCRAQNFTRSLVNEPGNVLPPPSLAARAQAMCREAGLACEVYSSEKIQELKMEAFWAVAKGSEQPPALIVMTYQPGRRDRGRAGAWPGRQGHHLRHRRISIKPADGWRR